MLSGTSSLRHVRLDVELLKCLPLSRREALRSLSVYACTTQARAVPDVVQAVLECQQLEELRIDCICCPLEFPVLDLRHLEPLSRCDFLSMPAPGSLLLSRGSIDLQPSLNQVAGWSKLQRQVRDRVLYMDIWARELEGLQAWPPGIAAFHGIQFLHIECDDIQASTGDDMLDLAHLASIPHVSLRGRNIGIKVSTGSWKLLELHSRGIFNVAFTDIKTFMKSMGAFYFKFDEEERPEDLIKKLEKAGADTGTVLHEHPDTLDQQLVVLSNTKPDSNNPTSFGVIFMSARIDYKHPI